MNLRKDHYFGKRGCPSALYTGAWDGSNKPIRVFGGLSVSSASLLANGDQPKHFVVVVVLSVNKPIKTFNNGSLGSGIDEERSEMR